MTTELHQLQQTNEKKKKQAKAVTRRKQIGNLIPLSL